MYDTAKMDCWQAETEPDPIDTDGNTNGQSQDLTLAELAQQKRLSVHFLRSLGVVTCAGIYNEHPHVEIPYFHADGSPARTRYRKRGKNGKADVRWRAKETRHAVLNRATRQVDICQALPIVCYGLSRLSQWQSFPYLLIVEGESDCWAAWAHGIPAIGIPGVGNTKLLELSHVSHFSTLYVAQEDDSAGETFPGKVATRLAEIGYSGELRAFSTASFKKRNGHATCNDLSDLHAAAPNKFVHRFAEVLRESRPEPIPDPAELQAAAALKANRKGNPPTHYSSSDQADLEMFLNDVYLPAIVESEWGPPGRGGRWVCRFHPDDETKPDFTVFHEGRRWFYKCHSGQCTASGDAARFIEQWRNCGFREAIEILGYQRKTPPKGCERAPTTATYGGANAGITLEGIQSTRVIPAFTPPQVVMTGDGTQPDSGGNEETEPETPEEKPEDGPEKLDEFHNRPIFDEKISQCRRINRAVEEIENKDHVGTLNFPCGRRIDCDHCGPVWIYNRQEWYSQIVAQWPEVHSLKAIDSHHASLAVAAISRRRRKGELAFYIRIPIPQGIALLSSVSHKYSEPCTQDEAQEIVRLTIPLSVATKKRITATKTQIRKKTETEKAVYQTIAYEEFRELGKKKYQNSAWFVEWTLANGYVEQDNPELIARKLKKDPDFMRVRTTEASYYSGVFATKRPPDNVRDSKPEPTGQRQQSIDF